jgi:hypothetical protein
MKVKMKASLLGKLLSSQRVMVPGAGAGEGCLNML